MMDAPTPRPMRLFFAVLPDAAARARLAPIALDTAARCDGRATLPRTLHLTLVFVGSVTDAQAIAAREAGDAMAWPHCVLVLDKLGWFARAKVAWASPSRIDPALAEAQAGLAAALARRGVPTEARPWRPHVTLARDCKRGVDGAIEPPVAWTIDRVVLVGSELEANGPRYRELADWPVE